MSYKDMCALLSMVFSYEEMERGLSSIIENQMMFPLCDVEPQEIEMILKRLKNKSSMVKQTLRTLEYTSEILELDTSDSVETLTELLGIISFVYEKVANAR